MFERIVHYYPEARRVRSGVTEALQGWAAAAASRGLGVLIADAGPNHDSPVMKSDGVEYVEVHHRGVGRQATVPVGLRGVLRRGDLLVLHEGWLTANLVAGSVAVRAGISYVTVPHGVYESEIIKGLRRPRAPRQAAETHLLTNAAAVHVFFDSERKLVQRVAPKAKIFVAPTGYTIPKRRWSRGTGYISWLGRMDPQHKGLDLLVRAFSLMPEAERPRLRLHGYDYRSGFARLQRIAEDSGLGAALEIGGPLYGEAKWRFLEGSDLYVHPSRWECHSIALLENLALGVPTVVSASMHISGPLAKAGAALVAQPEPYSLSAAMVQALRSESLGEAGRAFVREKLNWEDCIEVWLNHLRVIACRR